MKIPPAPHRRKCVFLEMKINDIGSEGKRIPTWNNINNPKRTPFRLATKMPFY